MPLKGLCPLFWCFSLFLLSKSLEQKGRRTCSRPLCTVNRHVAMVIIGSYDPAGAGEEDNPMSIIYSDTLGNL